MAWGKPTPGPSPIDLFIARITSDDPSLTSLHILPFRKPTNDEFIRLFQALAHNSNLHTFYASGHHLEPDAVAALAKALHTNKGLRSLNVGNGNFGDENVEVLSSGLEVNHGLELLDLENKGFGYQGIQALSRALEKNSTLHKLVLCRNALTDDDICLFIRGLISAQGVSGHKLSGSTLRELNLCDNRFGVEGARAIADYLKAPECKLEDLDVSGNLLGEQGGSLIAKALSGNTSLVNLQMVHTMGSEPGTRGDGVLIAFAEALSVNKTLRTLNLDDNRIGSIGFQTLVDALCKNLVSTADDKVAATGLKKLRLRQNQIGDSGVASFGSTHNENGLVLEQLDLGVNGITDVGFQHVLNGCSRVDRICLFGNSIRLAQSGLFDEAGWSACRWKAIDIGANGIQASEFGSLCTKLAAGMLASLEVLEAGGNYKEAVDQQEGSSHTEEDAESLLWSEHVSLVSEARPDLKVHWRLSSAAR